MSSLRAIPSIPLQSGPLYLVSQLALITTGWGPKKNGIEKEKNTQMRSNESLVKAIILMVWIVFVAPLENVVLLPPTDV